MCDADLHLLGTDAVAPQEAAVGEVESVAAAKFVEALRVCVAPDGVQQLVQVVGVVAGGRFAGTAQHTQREHDLQGVGGAGQSGDVNLLQVRVLDRSVELGGVLVLGFQAVGYGATHRLLADGNRSPAVGGVPLIPVTRVEKGVGRVEFAFEGEYGGGLERHDLNSFSWGDQADCRDAKSLRQRYRPATGSVLAYQRSWPTLSSRCGLIHWPME